MAQIIEKRIKTHENIYLKGSENRTIPIRISLPNRGIDNNTNVLVVSYGYAAEYKANVFTKLMQILPDKYNLVVVCGYYFGATFLKESNLIMDQNRGCHIEVDETAKEFNDMGIMQALDTVYMTLAALDYINRKMHEVKNVLIFGSSHGGYIAHLANLFCPGLYTYVIEISAYMIPYYLNHVREMRYVTQGTYEDIDIEYLVTRRADLRYDRRVYDLQYLYKTTDSNCRIIAFHGKDDWMVNCQEKEAFIKDLGDKAQIIIFGKGDVDGVLVKNASHGLGIDFINFFSMMLPAFLQTEFTRQPLRDEDVILGKGELDLVIDYKTLKPIWKSENGRWIEANIMTTI